MGDQVEMWWIILIVCQIKICLCISILLFLQLVDFFWGGGGGGGVFKHITLLTDLVHFEAQCQWFCPETAEAKWGEMLAILDFGNRCHTFGI